MNDKDQMLTKAGEEIGRLLGDRPDRGEIESQRAGLLKSVRRSIRRRAFVRTAVAAGGVVLAAAIAVIAVSRTKDAPMAFSIGDSGDQGAGVRWFQNDAVSPVTAAFGDGSRVTFGTGTRGRIIRSTMRDVSLVLEDGLFDADIKSAGRTKWEIAAGPFNVTVTGTDFSVRWDPRPAVLDVAVRQGAVVVTGIPDQAGGMTLAAGQRLSAAGKAVRIIPIASAGAETTGDTPGRVAKATAAEDPQIAKRDAPSNMAPPAHERKTQPPIPSKMNRDMEPRSFDALLESEGVEGLWALAESARYSRDTVKARGALSAIRARFPQSGEAKTAAFLLGRTAMESDQSPDEAAKWFNTYLSELPDGPLSEEASGRLIDALVKAKKQNEAREAARDYLKRYPNGIFAEVARSAAKN